MRPRKSRPQSGRTMTRISSAHHVLGIEHLLCQFWHSECTVLLRATRGERREADHEEMQTREWDQIDSELTQVTVQLTREAKASCHATHGCTEEMVQISVSWSSQLQCAETDVVESLVVKKHAFIGILDQLME